MIDVRSTAADPYIEACWLVGCSMVVPYGLLVCWPVRLLACWHMMKLEVSK